MKNSLYKKLSFCVFFFLAGWGCYSGLARPTTRAEVVPSEDVLTLAFPAPAGPVDYTKYGVFTGVGTAGYQYTITNAVGLAQAVGEGIYPNVTVFNDPTYQQLVSQGKLGGSHWDYTGNTAALNFYKWATTGEDPGVKLFYIANNLENAGLYDAAIKAFQALIVHYPRTISFTLLGDPWYPALSAVDHIEVLLRHHPELNMRFVGAKIDMDGKYDNITTNDVFRVTPGQLVTGSQLDVPVFAGQLPVVKTLGGSKTQVRKYQNGHWELFVDGKPFMIKGVSYSPTKVGLDANNGTAHPEKDWQIVDYNGNGTNDVLFESYVDVNENGTRDSNEAIVGDAKLLKDMGVNTIRAYHHLYDKTLLRKLYQDYGLYVLCGDFFGAYGIGNGTAGGLTDYENPVQQQAMLDSVQQMVLDARDEPYVIMWVLGNENNYGVGTNANTKPDAYYQFVDRAAQLIHQLDPTRPVALCNGEVGSLDRVKANCPNVDVFSANSYRGSGGFGRSFFRDVREQLDRPAFLSEFGCSAFSDTYTRSQAEAFQAMYLANSWEDILAHQSGFGEGNSIGGVLFEFTDEWWKGGDVPDKIKQALPAWYAARLSQYQTLSPNKHDMVPQASMPFLDGWDYEEWLGVASQSTGSNSPYARVLRPGYFSIQSMWNLARHDPAISPDFNRDGRADLALQNRLTGDHAIWMNGQALASLTGIIPKEWQIAGLGDFNADGKTDYIWQNNSTGQKVISLLDGTTIVSSTLLFTASTDWRVGGVADFNGDGRADVLIQNQTTGQRGIMLMSGTQAFATVDLGTVPVAWQLVGAGRFSQDKVSDLLLQNLVTGEIQIIIIRDDYATSLVSLPPLPAGWRVACTGDYDGDGQTDIVIQNRTTGEGRFIYMNGTVSKGFSSFPLPVEWEVAGVGDYAP